MQHGLLDALTREFGSPGVIGALRDGAPTETLDPSVDVSVGSLAATYEDAPSARAALRLIIETTGERLRRKRDLSLGDGGAIFRGRFLRGMPLVSYVWRNASFVLHVLAVGAFDESEIRAIADAMDDRVP